ncbi:hypothetical protein SMD11_6894 [Streptomyces albireticuli]|uniref:Uncharacterized protein n=1 Tax=Streptomyces albireticuli TaxID=1940 RepID=A0A1Z2LDS9_9ACTN|nr:hypothetical protein [Streptomyces albireticuli]ARZ72470.1 hypothetical protein SMD11_6894 [Streptomyces albireticuli]
MFILALIAFPFALLAGFGHGGRLVLRGIRAGAWSAPGLWGGIGLLAGSGAALAFAYGMFAGFGGLDRSETCGASYDSKFAGEHDGDPLFPLHSWCGATHDLVPSWVNPSVISLTALSVVSLGVAAVTGVARITRTWAARRAGHSPGVHAP